MVGLGEGEGKRRMLLHLHDDSVDQILLSFASILELASRRSVEVLLKH